MSKKPITILGIDPGSAVTGYGVVRSETAGITPIDWGCIRPPKSLSLYDRYLFLHRGVEELLQKHSTDAFVIETQYMQKNVRSALTLGMAKASLLLAAKKAGIPVYDLNPADWKRAIGGASSARKEHTQSIVQKLLKLSSAPQPLDAADALGMAVCFALRNKHPLKGMIKP